MKTSLQLPNTFRRAGALLALLLFALSAGAQKHNNMITGAWKYSNQSAINDFKQILNSIPNGEYAEEYFVFEDNNKFMHQFVDKTGRVIKTLTGKWKTNGDKIAISYSDVDYTVKVNYFFLDKDLVLGQDFNHVIFTRGSLQSQNFAQK